MSTWCEQQGKIATVSLPFQLQPSQAKLASGFTELGNLEKLQQMLGAIGTGYTSKLLNRLTLAYWTKFHTCELTDKL